MRYASSSDSHRSRVARRVVPLLLSLTLLAATPVAAAPHPHPDADASVIATWNEMAVTTVNGGTASPTNFNYYAFVHLAMYNAVAAITGEYELYKWDGVAPKVASPEAAAAAAAYRILTNYFPGTNTANLNAQLAASLANVRNPVARANGEAFGIEAANRIIFLRTGDGRNGPVTLPTQGTLPGQWRPTPTAFLPFTGTAWLGGVTPIALTSTTQFDPGAPAPLGSPQDVAELAEVQAIGEVGSPRTDFQTRTAWFFSDAGIFPMQRALQEFALRRGLDIDDSARLFAAVDTAIADGAGTDLACEAAGAAVAASHGDSRGARSAAGQLDAVGHHAAVSRLAERTVLCRRGDGQGDGTPLRIGRPEHHLPGPRHGSTTSVLRGPDDVEH